MPTPVINSIKTAAAVVAAAKLVHPLFVEHGWRYLNDSGPPTEGRLVEVLQRLIKEVQDEKHCNSVETGRFCVVKDADGNVSLYLSIGEVSAPTEPTP